jgi:integrase
MSVEIVPVENLAKLAQFWMYQIKMPGRCCSTVLDVGSTMRMFVTFIGQRKFIDRGRQSTTIYAEWMAYLVHEKYAPSTIGKISTVTGSFCKWLQNGGYSLNNAHQATPRPKIKGPNEAARSPVTQEEYEKLIAMTSGPGRWMILLAWNTGMGILDCSLLQWANVDMRRFVISIVRRKTGTPATIPFVAGEELHRELIEKRKLVCPQHWPNQPDRGIFFVDPDCAAAGLKDQNLLARKFKIDQAFRAVCPKPNYKTFHNLRAAAISNLINAGVAAPIVCKIVGHSDPSMMMEYYTPDVESLRDAVRKGIEYRERDVPIEVEDPPGKDSNIVQLEGAA